MDEKRLKALDRRARGRDDLFVESLTMTSAAWSGGGDGVLSMERDDDVQTFSWNENNGSRFFQRDSLA